MPLLDQLECVVDLVRQPGLLHVGDAIRQRPPVLTVTVYKERLWAVYEVDHGMGNLSTAFVSLQAGVNVCDESQICSSGAVHEDVQLWRDGGVQGWQVVQRPHKTAYGEVTALQS
jgi:hypothetical protein